MENQTRPLRAVVLDNDETTGSYGIVFSILTFLSKKPDVYVPHIHSILAKLAYWMEDHHVFRPGLRILIQKLLYLRDINLIDVILMYTNQRHDIPSKYEDTPYALLYSPPLAISFMMDVLFSAHVFDSHFTRPRESWGQSAIVPKYFGRILDAYPTYEKDSRGILFLDDLATPENIQTIPLPSNKTSSKSLIRVTPYKINLSDEQLENLMTTLFGNMWLYDSDYHSIIKQYVSRSPLESSPNNDTEFRVLSEKISNYYINYNIKCPMQSQVKDHLQLLYRKYSYDGRKKDGLAITGPGATAQGKAKERTRARSCSPSPTTPKCGDQ